MNLESKINDEIKLAMKNGEKLRLEALRSIKAAILEYNKSGSDHIMNDDDEIKLLKNAAKRRKDAFEMYSNAGRQELADKEKSELAIIEEFLPAQLSEETISQKISDIIAELGATGMKDMGKVMGRAMKVLSASADGSLVQKFVKEKLSELN